MANEVQPKEKQLIDRIFKPVLIVCLVIIVVTYSALFFIRQKEKKEEAWDRKAVATAMVALDQFVPEADYGPASVTGWTVIHNPDGTTTVWAPKSYGRISVMFTDDGEDYTPYHISVDGIVMLGG